MRARLGERARELGASDLRIADARADALTRERMRASFARGDLDTWGYDDGYAAAASDAETLLEGARRIVCVAVPYRTRDAAARGPLGGRVSNYAWSHDYHRTLRAMLTELATMMDDFAGKAVTRIACDTAPLGERAAAARAGLGWIGKHTGLIAPGAGSYVFLGEVVTSLALPVDAPLGKTCGSCTRCVTGCPTGALRGDYTIDATRCIADLTQRTDPIPRALRSLIGDWVWGCDICQVVCPPNFRTSANVSDAFAPQDEVSASPDLVALLHLKSTEFKRRYRATAMGWRGAAVLRRNAAIALGNLGDRSAVPALMKSLSLDPHPMVRGASAWALGRIASPPALASLESAARSERNASVCEEIAFALAEASGTMHGGAPLEHL
ncbi:MAG: tRNA epoxyqueuosine(34) reductase QueG [Vulcanimicrobiaceae bacterium]